MDEQQPDLPEGVKMMLRNDPEEAWKKVEASLRKGHKPRGKQVPFGQSWLRIAATVALLVGITSVIYILNSNNTDTHIIANNTLASKSVLLPDSSVVYLHGGSEITYNDSYTDNRNVAMKGQVFFEVKRDPGHPFKVTVGQSIVQVLGTSFNIDDDASKLDVTVSTGKVSVTTPVHNVIYLVKGEKASYDKSAQKISKINNDDINYDSWRTRVLQFQNTPLPQVISTLEKYFDVKIIFDQRKASAITYTSDFSDPTLQEVLVEMKDVLGIEYRESGSQVIVTIP